MSSAPISIYKDLSTGCVLQVKVYIQPADEARFWELFRPAYDAVIAEPECRFFVVSKPVPPQPEENVTCLSWVEGWSKPAQWLLEVQMHKSYYEPYISETEKMFVKPRVVELTSAVEGMCDFKLPASTS
ncbi:hypothetical protein PV08_04765 [Exophiala spinifera]|uniref:ABM domain-containing protein n=1 Tax=Exophiala spinifera TaxID=91928 RepID=A0A0D2BG44_9EURO|nr:uncharacterized protein PV08_04765 [Exophiala spinifera]KIW17570.1 hypothetical protein PV08_04765 [Exophiala spinifera]